VFSRMLRLLSDCADARKPHDDLFADTPQGYPHRPGWKGHHETGRQAAQAVAVKAKSLRERCLEVIQAAPGPISADEVAARLDYEPMWIRPRISELGKQGLIVPVAERAKNKSGCSALLWRAA
jgi:hypothetical protein